MAMGGIAMEEGVLKLVRPGRRVEVHKQPIAAEEVMRKYPRHSITRQDIFEFPWIVVKREAVLTPGKVFFIVPNRTIYQLLKAREHGDQPSSSRQKQQSAQDHGRQPVSEHTSPPKACAGVSPKRHDQRQRLKKQFFSCATVSPSDEETDSDEGHQTDAEVGSRKELSPTKKRTRGELKQKPQIYPKVGPRHGKENNYGQSNITAKVAGLKITDNKQATCLKSCVRKPDSARKLLRLKVDFTLPVPPEEEERVERRSNVNHSRMRDIQTSESRRL